MSGPPLSFEEGEADAAAAGTHGRQPEHATSPDSKPDTERRGVFRSDWSTSRFCL